MIRSWSHDTILIPPSSKFSNLDAPFPLPKYLKKIRIFASMEPQTFETLLNELKGLS